jgi:N-acetylglucosaminyl-diphospho-decaprenol L-rhamnosyltransferase
MDLDPEKHMRLDVAVIVVNYGTAQLAIEAVESVLARHPRSQHVEVHLVDNASPGDDAFQFLEALRRDAWCGRVVLYLEKTNHGFGRGHNVVLQALAQKTTPPDKVFLLNPDARLKTQSLAELVAFLDTHPDTAIVGCGIDRPNDGPAVTAAFRFPSLLSEFADAVKVGLVSRLLARWGVSLPPEAGTRPVDWVSGAAFMARFSALQRVGFFDLDFFLYFEETELMHRLRKTGWQIWHCAEIRVEHVAGAATGVHGRDARPKRLPAYWFDSWQMYFVKTRGLGYALACAVAKLGGAALHTCISCLRGRPPKHVDGFISDFYLYALRPLLGRIGKRNSP